MSSMTVGQLRKFLARFNEEDIVYGYEGELCGIVVCSKRIHPGYYMGVEKGAITNDGKVVK